MKSGNLNFLEPSGHLGAVMGLLYLYFYIIFIPVFSVISRDVTTRKREVRPPRGVAGSKRAAI